MFKISCINYLVYCITKSYALQKQMSMFTLFENDAVCKVLLDM